MDIVAIRDKLDFFFLQKTDILGNYFHGPSGKIFTNKCYNARSTTFNATVTQSIYCHGASNIQTIIVPPMRSQYMNSIRANMAMSPRI